MATISRQSNQSQTPINPPADFAALPLDVIISQPLTAVVNAQMLAAKATQTFIESFIKDGKPVTIDFSTSIQDGDNAPKTMQISAPLLSIVPVPHLRIDSLSISFKYEISQTIKDETAKEQEADGNISAGSALAPWVKATLNGRVTSSAKQESTMNRSGTLDIELHASEAAMPEGLAKILNLLSNSITVTDTAK